MGTSKDDPLKSFTPTTPGAYKPLFADPSKLKLDLDSVKLSTPGLLGPARHRRRTCWTWTSLTRRVCWERANTRSLLPKSPQRSRPPSCRDSAAPASEKGTSLARRSWQVCVSAEGIWYNRLAFLRLSPSLNADLPTMRDSQTVKSSIQWIAALAGAACILVSAWVARAADLEKSARFREHLDRGLVAVQKQPGQVYLGWRLLENDPPQIAFNVYRRQGESVVRLNAEPIQKTTDFIDASAPPARPIRCPVLDGREGPASAAVGAGHEKAHGYVSIHLQGKYQIQKVGIADLDGDGQLDYVVKQPADNIDPYEKYWTRSPDTYKLEAYSHQGKFLWRYDLGWAIERGIWYSPYVVYDLDGDGKAEVAVKTGEGDPRDADGRVQSGPEYSRSSTA